MHALQVVVPFFIAGIGTCFAGILLDHVQYWEVYQKVDEIFLLLPSILGLKGNLQMTLASRFSTHSHMGHIQTTGDLLALSCANLSLNQCFSIVISLSASVLTIGIHLLTSDDPFNPKNALIISASAVLTSSVTSFILDILMILVVQVSAWYNINPDNVATPIAASLGDTTALMLSSILSDTFYSTRNTQYFYWITSLVILFYLFLVPVWASVAQENIHTTNILVEASHWYPLVVAMLISSVSGVILKAAVHKSDEIALYNPVLCGVGGNLVAVQASRLATLLHRNQPIGQLPEGETICINPCQMFCSPKPGYSITRLLIGIVMPGQFLFYFFLVYVNSQKTDPSMPFLALYLVGSQLQVIVLLYLAYVLTYALWVAKIDPDNSTIPYLTSISDVIGAMITTFIVSIAVPNGAKPG